MGRKKQFIDKKTAHRFVLMHRSQQDPMYHDEEGSKLVLHPADAATAKALIKLGMGDQVAGARPRKLSNANLTNEVQRPVKELREVDERGFPIDGYDYNKHLAPIGGGGMFVTKTGQLRSSNEVAIRATPSTATLDQETDALEESLYRKSSDGAAANQAHGKRALGLPTEMFASDRAMDRMLEAITLSTDRMDPDMKALLEEEEVDFEEAGFGDELEDCVNTLEDDFMGQLLAAEEAAGPAEKGFDFDAHVARLMAEADDGSDGEYDDLDEDERDAMLEEVAASRPRRDIDTHFDTLLANEYGDDEIGELEHGAYDDRVAGTVDLGSDQVQRLVSEFQTELNSDKERTKEIGATEGNKFVRDLQRLEVRAENAAAAAAAGIEGEDGTESDASEPSPEEINSHFGYQTKDKAKWDCETIVSTYSILDNHPKLVKADPSKRKKNRKPRLQRQAEGDESCAASHGASDEGGSESGDRDDGPSRADGAAAAYAMLMGSTAVPRDREETAEEKRLRKNLIKEEQRRRRSEKKSTKLVFKEERVKQKRFNQALKAAAAPPNGTSTFKF